MYLSVSQQHDIIRLEKKRLFSVLCYTRPVFTFGAAESNPDVLILQIEREMLNVEIDRKTGVTADMLPYFSFLHPHFACNDSVCVCSVGRAWTETKNFYATALYFVHTYISPFTKMSFLFPRANVNVRQWNMYLFIYFMSHSQVS